MTITKDHIGGLVFLCFSIAYGYYANEIVLFPGDEFEPFNARSMPTALALMGAVLAVCQLLTASKKEKECLKLTGYDFSLVAKLLVLMVLFAVSLEWLGFMVGTIFFLAGGYWLLGERRIRIVVLASVPFAVGFWYVLTQLLDIYLAPGRVWTMMLGS